MDLEELRLNLAKLFNGVTSPQDHLDKMLKSIVQDDSAQLVLLSSILSQSLTLPSAQSQNPPLDRSIVSHLLHFCCVFDAVDCATALLNGEVGMVPLLNDTDVNGRTALHTAAEVHAPRCIELLLRKRARTDLRTRDGRGRLALDLALCSSRMDAVWNPDEYSVEDLVICLGEKDLSSVKLLSERTKEIADVAYAEAIEGRVVSLAALLMVAVDKVDKVNEAVMVLHDADSGKKTTIYESLVREVLALGREDTSSLRVAKRTHTLTQEECAEKRKLLLCEIELLQFLGNVADSGCNDRKVISPLILATQAGDEAVIQVLLKANTGIDDTDAEGNSPLHWCLKNSKMSSHQQMKILSILLKHGARVDQKNKLGLTAVHVAAANGNLEALKVLIERDPESINIMTEIKETPLFFAVNNDRMDCAELLLHQGANSEVLNLRRQRPIDMAKSQDMRFMLNSSNIILMNRALTLQSKCIPKPQDESNDAMPESEGVLNATCYNAKTELCKYFDYHGGCSRGSKCCFAHGREEIQQLKQVTHSYYHSPSPEVIARKVFVGGLPPSMDSDSLGRAFEELFGAVEDAIVVVCRIDNQVHSRGFGFVIFKHEKSASDAIEAHYISISGKEVEIKSAVPKPPSPKSSPIRTPPKQQEQDLDEKQQTPPCNEEIKLEPMSSWVDKLLNGQPKPLSPVISSAESQTAPKWFRIFVKWLPRFLAELSRNGRDGEYALSSLKADFKTKFGMELYHASLGFSKLSDFIKSLPQLCRLKVVPTGHIGLANHMVILLPKTPTPKKQPFHHILVPDNIVVEETGHGNKPYQDALLSPLSEDDGGTMRGMEVTAVVSFKQYELFPTCKKDIENMVINQKRNMVLEVLCKRRNSSSPFFLRDIDFYTDYISSIARRRCFWCKERKMIWANFPCHHLVWCSDCKVEAVKAAGTFQHRCVICDATVQKIDPVPWKEGFEPTSGRFSSHELTLLHMLSEDRRMVAVGQ